MPKTKAATNVMQIDRLFFIILKFSSYKNDFLIVLKILLLFTSLLLFLCVSHCLITACKVIDIIFIKQEKNNFFSEVESQRSTGSYYIGVRYEQ